LGNKRDLNKLKNRKVSCNCCLLLPVIWCMSLQHMCYGTCPKIYAPAPPLQPSICRVSWLNKSVKSAPN
jgi:hypothetical protein